MHAVLRATRHASHLESLIAQTVVAMAVTPTARLGLNRWSAGTDPWPARAGWDTNQQQLDDAVAMDAQGPINTRPVAGIRGRFYFTTDTRKLYRDDGTQWNEIGPNGGVVPTTQAFGDAAAEGTSARSARADHKHAMPAHNDAAHSAVHLSALAAPTAPVAFGGQRITGLADPVGGQDGATLQTVIDRLNAVITGGGVPSSIVAGAVGSEGVSSKAARADHTHPFPTDGWQPYTPVWSTSGTAPVKGSLGVLEGFYKQVGKWISFRIRLLAGTNTTFGTGEFRFTYPVPALNIQLGGLLGYVFRSGPQYWGLIGVGFSTTTFRMIGTTNNALVNTGSPVAFAAGDELNIGGTYEPA